jgi:hypothetical protein
MKTNDPNLVTRVSNADLQLTGVERQLIANFRATAACAKDMLVDLSHEYARTLPAAPVRLSIVARTA